MSGDITRSTFHPDRHYSNVRLQQGRVLLDAEWNEQGDIQTYRDRTTTRDVVGQSGAQLNDAGYGLQIEGGAVHLTPGHYYVDGILCENGADVDITQQPDLPTFTLPTAQGSYLAYLDVWERDLTALDQPDLREVALGGPDTALRTQTVCQVKLQAVPDTSTCGDFGSAWAPDGTASTGQLRARAQPSPQVDNLCQIPPGAGYRRLENQLYRIEVHDPGTAGTATFKWSRDNGSVASILEKIDGSVLTVSDSGRDAILGFAGDQWVELSDEERTLHGQAGILVQLDSVQGNELTVRSWPGNTPLTMAAFGPHPTVRRWDSPGAGQVNANGWIDVEDGVQVQFAAGSYQTADYWLIPARTLTGDVEWPQDSTGPLLEPRDGIAHHYAPLGLLHFDGAAWTVKSDCRHFFPPATELTHLVYIGGDGQEAMPGGALPQPLQVGVLNGSAPVPGASIRFHVVAGTGSLTAAGTTGGDITVRTDGNGRAECTWQLDATTMSQQVEATLVDDRSTVIGVPLEFNAGLSVASEVAYDPSACPALAAANAGTVQKAIDQLCQTQGGAEPGVHIKDIRFAGGELRNDANLAVTDLARGIELVADRAVAELRGEPVCSVTLDLPFPVGQADVSIWGDAVIGTRPITLLGETLSDGELILWRPAGPAQAWLAGRLPSLMPKIPGLSRILTHLTVLGDFIWDQQDPKVFLDGDTFGVRNDGSPGIDIQLPSGDGRRGGKFEMWFWLVLPTVNLASLAVAPTAVIGGQPATGTVTLSGPAPADTVVNLTSSDPAHASVPAAVMVGQGQTSQSFSLTTTQMPANTSVQVTITAAVGNTAQTAQLTVFGPRLVIGGPGGPVVQPGPIAGPGLGDPAGGGNPVNHAPGEGIQPGPAQPGAVPGPQVNDQPIDLLRPDAVKGPQADPQGAALAALTLSPSAVVGGELSSGTITLPGPGAQTDTTLILDSTNPRVASVPQSVTVPAGSTAATFAVTTTQVMQVVMPTITVTGNGMQQSALLTVTPDTSQPAGPGPDPSSSAGLASPMSPLAVEMNAPLLDGTPGLESGGPVDFALVPAASVPMRRRLIDLLAPGIALATLLFSPLFLGAVPPAMAAGTGGGGVPTAGGDIIGAGVLNVAGAAAFTALLVQQTKFLLEYFVKPTNPNHDAIVRLYVDVVALVVVIIAEIVSSNLNVHNGRAWATAVVQGFGVALAAISGYHLVNGFQPQTVPQPVGAPDVAPGEGAHLTTVG